MANLKEVRERIKSVKNTQQITKAMKMVAASKLRRAQMAITQMRPYADKLNSMLRNILSNLGGDGSTSFGAERSVEHVCMVVVTSNKGLCGAFNTNVIKAAVASINDKYAAQKEAGKLTILPIGKKGYAYFKKRYTGPIIEDYINLFDDLSFKNVSKVPQKLMDTFEAKEYDRVEVAYGRFKNAAVQIPECIQFLPVEKLESKGETKKHRADLYF